MTVIIVNPAAGRGRAARFVERLRSEFAGADLRLTQRAGDEERLAREACIAGASVIVAVGGDGTWGNCANGMLATGTDASLAVIAAGTGNDFAKTTGAPAGDIARTAELVRRGTTKRVDVGRADDRWFLNSCGFGFDAAVLERVERISALKGSTRYLAAALAELGNYSATTVRIVIAGEKVSDTPTLLTVVSNGEWFGGMFRIAPGAAVDDGQLDVVCIAEPGGRLRAASRLALLLSAVRGSHIERDGVSRWRASEVELEFDEPPWCNTDGELRRANGRRVRLVVEPRALRVVAEA